MGRLVDRFGIRLPLTLGAIMLGLGYAAAALATTFWQFVLAQSLLIGMLGSSVAFGPLVADVSRWFTRRRGIAVAIVASGNYLAGAVWPPILQHSFASFGWRPTHLAIGLFCVATMLPLAWLHGRRPACRAWLGCRCRSLSYARRPPCPSCRCSWSLPACPAASPCRCRRSISSPIAATSAMARPEAPRCCP